MAKNPARLVSQVVARVMMPKKMIMMGTKMKPNFYTRGLVRSSESVVAWVGGGGEKTHLDHQGKGDFG